MAQRLEEGATGAMVEHGFRLVSCEMVRGVEYRLYENEQALPRAFIVPRAIIEPSEKATLAAMVKEDFNPRETVYLADPVGGLGTSDLPWAGNATGEAEIVKYEPTRVEVRVKVDKGGWLVLTDSYTPLWQAFVDGNPTDLLVADQLFRAIEVPAGEHVVSFSYKSRAVTQAGQLTTWGILLGVILFALNRLNMRNWQHDASTTSDQN